MLYALGQQGNGILLGLLKGVSVMNKKIKQILSMLTIEEKKKLNEMLKDLEQKRQPLPIPQE